MGRKVRVLLVIAVIVSALVPNAALCQTAFPQGVAASTSSTATTTQGAPAAAQPAPAGLLEQEELTGNWGGARTRWRDKGVVLDSSLAQFYQGVSAGGTATGSEYNATAQAKLEFDFGKLAGWQFWSAEIKGEWRFGGPLLTGTGTINPVNTAAMIPGSDGSKFSLTAVNVTRLFPIDLKAGKLVALSFGRYNLLDALDEDFFAGGGTERFFNIAQIGPLTVLRQVPLITNAVNFAYIKGARHSFGAAITTKKYTPFDAIRPGIDAAVVPGGRLKVVF